VVQLGANTVSELVPQSYVIRTAQDVALADDLLLDLYRKRDLAEEKRREIWAAQKEATDLALKPWRDAITGYEDAILMVKSALRVYREITAKAESAAARAYLAGGTAPVPAVASKVTTTKRVKKWRITGKLDEKFMQPNEDMINAYVKAGRDVPGVETYEEEQIVMKGGKK